MPVEKLTLKWEHWGHFDQYDFNMNEYRIGDVTFNETVTNYNMPPPSPTPRNKEFFLDFSLKM